MIRKKSVVHFNHFDLTENWECDYWFPTIICFFRSELMNLTFTLEFFSLALRIRGVVGMIIL